MRITEVKRCTNAGWKCDNNYLKDTLDFNKKVEDLLERLHTFVLAYIDPKGIAMTKTMSVKERDGIKHIWFVTHTSSRHGIQLLKSSKATTYFSDSIAYESLTLIGNVYVEKDSIIRKKCWRDFYESGFPGGTDDPEYLVIRFEPQGGIFVYNDLNIDFTLELEG